MKLSSGGDLVKVFRGGIQQLASPIVKTVLLPSVINLLSPNRANQARSYPKLSKLNKKTPQSSLFRMCVVCVIEGGQGHLTD